MKKVLYLVLVGVLVITGLLATVSCGSSSSTTTKPGGAQTSPPPGGTTGPDFKPAAVTIKNMAFSPATITVAIGTTVTWTNQDPSHTVTSRTRIFDSGLIAEGGTFSYTFNTAGDFEYYCTIHPTMVGHVIVQ